MSSNSEIAKRLDRNAVKQALAGLHEMLLTKSAEAIYASKKSSQAEDIAINGILTAMSGRQHG